jgi:hypothetical protein
MVSWCPPDTVKFGLAGRDRWERLAQLRAGQTTHSGLVPVRPVLVAGVRYCVRYRTGAIRDGVLLSVGRSAASTIPPETAPRA